MSLYKRDLNLFCIFSRVTFEYMISLWARLSLLMDESIIPICQDVG